ncbi:hypothetical protein ACVINW_001319 [Bradyrhizobium sp. USDA 4461]
MTNEAVATQPEQSHKDYQAERAHKDFQASIESGRAATQAAILINGGAATAILAFLSKQAPPPPDVVAWASVSLLIYAFGVIFSAASMFCSAYSLGYYASSWQTQFFANEPQEKLRAEQISGKQWLNAHRGFTWLSFISFLSASGFIARSIIVSGITKIGSINSVTFATAVLNYPKSAVGS